MIQSEKVMVDTLAFFFFKEGEDGEHVKALMQTWRRQQDSARAKAKATKEGNEKLASCLSYLMGK